MTQRTDCAHKPLGSFRLRSLLVQSLSCLGVLSLLSSNLVLAQTSPSPDAVVVPTVKDSKPKVADRGVAKSAPSPARLARLRQRLSSTPAAVRPALPKPQVSTAPATQVSVPKVRSYALPTNKLPSIVKARPIRPLAKADNLPAPDYNNAYIDPTAYSTGATRGYTAPSKVVLSERSTGCKAVLRQGQGLSGSICGTASRRRSQSLNTARLSRRQAPNWATSRAVARTGIAPIRVGPISVSASGFSATRRTPSSFPGEIAFVNPVPRQSGGVYNRTLGLPGQPGNANTELLFPLTVPAPITSLFGWRMHPITGDRRFHAGTDLGAPLGTPVVAASAGDVAFADFLGGYGLTVVLDHNKFTQQTLYAHLSEIFVEPGEWVEQGSVIGRVGSTGNSTGPHLHFETRQLTASGWVATNPGVELEYALAQLVQALQTAKAPQQLGTGG